MSIGFAGALTGGVLALLSPCSVMLLPAFFAFAFDRTRTLIVRVVLFFLGLLSTLVPLGAAAGSLGALIQQYRGPLVLAASILVISIGALQVLAVPLPGLARKGSGDASSPVGVYVLGTVYGVAGVCAGPVLGTILTVAALGGDPLQGGILLGFYALGMVVPLLLLALMWARFGGRVRRAIRPRSLRIGRWENSWATIVAGAFSISIGVLLLVTDGLNGAVGILSSEQQAAAESGALASAAGISNAAVVLGFTALALAVIGVWALRSARSARGHGSARQATSTSDSGSTEP
ncbi:cytochrome c biogenesis CcdA family protein [Leifsonia sp. SIMBA_070]|uniref:cytochrome c biogenesis CcdA family protein n=1 Tax=Leifsonia sp. SIMBA_070 TaxID=3085810 RepID=UPI00397BCE22